MARPKKTDANQMINEPSTDVVITATPTYPSVAVGLAFDEVSKFWSVVTIKFNLETDESLITKVEKISTNKIIAQHEFMKKTYGEGLV